MALLKDSSGTIDIDLPVRGDLDDPEFGYGRVIGKALATLVVKIVASPFSLLGKLVGVEADELEYISFPAGRADLTPPELERVQNWLSRGRIEWLDERDLPQEGHRD